MTYARGFPRFVATSYKRWHQSNTQHVSFINHTKWWKCFRWIYISSHKNTCISWQRRIKTHYWQAGKHRQSLSFEAKAILSLLKAIRWSWQFRRKVLDLEIMNDGCHNYLKNLAFLCVYWSNFFILKPSCIGRYIGFWPPPYFWRKISYIRKQTQPVGPYMMYCSILGILHASSRHIHSRIIEIKLFGHACACMVGYIDIL